ncbi:PGF-pre-PGF domain-containing protein [Methanofollis sp. W23]|uniref:NosD domain-containing protein n=1 Tax=Methanofollis sp. W23 TaxID=2817849 RepID=UPI001AE31C3F|nr:NosD domain-containing protein [Methanofollis sp. W23]MBP2145739.1 PGF-pre-PGF domain-containing protein [Methanofollis sp. W23]
MRLVGMVIAAAMLLLLLTLVITPAAAEPLTDYRHIHVQVSNDGNARFNTFGNDTYYVKCDGGGLNAMHITNDASVRGGQVTISSDQSGTFYLTNTGGRGYNDEVILLLAVNGTIPDDFAVHIKSSGYRWEPGSIDDKEYVAGAVDESFGKEDFIYGPQIWRPSTQPDYPFFYGQDMTDTENTFNFMFIDLCLGQFYGDENTTDLGAVRIDYSFENLETFAAFDNYGYCKASNQDEGISWTNRVAGSGSSGYSVIGVPAPTEPTLTTITVSPETATLLVNENQTFTAMGYDQDGNEMPEVAFAWSSSNETVGTVNETGYFEALSSGTTTVFAVSGDVEGSAAVTVTALPQELTTIEVSAAPEQVLYPGEGHQFTATAYDQEGNEMPGITFAWSSSNETVGTVNETGCFEALVAGTTTITAENGAVNGTVEIPVETPPDWSFDLSGAEEKNVSRSGFIDLANEHPAEYTDYSSNTWGGVDLRVLVGMVDDDDPATLNTALAEKGYTIIVKGERRSRPFTLEIPSTDLIGEKQMVVANTMNGQEIRPGTFGREVYWPLKFLGGSREISALTEIELSLPKPSEIRVTPSEAVLKVGETATFSAETFDQYGNAIPDTPFAWSTDDESLGTIDENGLFTAVAGGSLNVTATYAGATGTAAVRVVPAGHEPATLYIDASGSGDYTTIQDAVTAAYDWDTIVVRDGTYNETVTVDKCLTIRSENGPEKTILNAPDPTAKVLLITTKDVTISDLTITGSSQSYRGLAVLVKDVEGVTFSGNIIKNNWNALFFDGCSGCVVRDNTFVKNAFGVHCERTSDSTIVGNEGVDNNYGAYILNGCTGLTVSGNTFTGGATGINIGRECTDNLVAENTLCHISSTGIRIDGAENRFTNNTIDDIPFYGIYLQNTGDNVFTGNVINASARAVGLIGGYNNVFVGNVFSNPTYWALYLGGATTKDNVFYLNDFVNVPTPTSAEVKQVWLSPEPVTYTYEGNTYTARLGNYWDTYTGVDKEGDGIGDEVYQIDGVNEQFGPLVKPKENYLVSAQPENGTASGKVSLKVPGCTFSAGEGGKKIAVDTSLVDSTLSDDGSEVTIYRGAYTLVFMTDGSATMAGGQITGNVTGISLIPRQLVLESAEAGLVGGSMVVNLTALPEDAVLAATLSVHPSAGVESAFTRTLNKQGLKNRGIASLLHVEKTGLEDGAEIANATIVMNVSKAWVDAVGGPGNVRILRLGEDGRSSVLNTICAGLNDQYGYGFCADSPEGLCDFGLVAVTNAAAPPASHSSSSSSGGSSNVAAISGSIPAGESQTFAVSKTAITRITVEAYDAIDDLLVTVQKASLTKDVPAPEGPTYQLIETALYHTDASAIDTVTLEFAVPTTWLKEHDLSTGKIVLLGYENDGWKPLKTTFVKEENGQALYSAEASGFSYFAIASGETTSATGQADETETPTPVVTDTPAPVEETTVPAKAAPTTQKSPVPWFLSIAAIGALFLVKRD